MIEKRYCVSSSLPCLVFDMFSGISWSSNFKSFSCPFYLYHPIMTFHRQIPWKIIWYLMTFLSSHPSPWSSVVWLLKPPLYPNSGLICTAKSRGLDSLFLNSRKFLINIADHSLLLETRPYLVLWHWPADPPFPPLQLFMESGFLSYLLTAPGNCHSFSFLFFCLYFLKEFAHSHA